MEGGMTYSVQLSSAFAILLVWEGRLGNKL